MNLVEMKKIASIVLISAILSAIFYLECKEITYKGDLLLDMMEYEAAINTYLEVLAENPQQHDIRRRIGYAYFQLNKIDPALKFIGQELIMFPDNGDAYDLLVFILYKLKRIEKAYHILPAVLFSLNGTKSPFNILTSVLFEFAGFPIRKPITEEEDSSSGLGDFILGMDFKKRGKYETARMYFRRALKRGYQPFQCFAQLADIELIQDNLTAFFSCLDEARETYKDLYGLSGNRYEIFESYFMSGLMYYKQFNIALVHQNFRLALESFKKALDLKPDSKDALFNIAAILYNSNKFKDAAKYFNKILEIEPENTEIIFYLGCCSENSDRSIPKKSEFDNCPKVLNLSKEFIDKPSIEYKYKFNNNQTYILHKINNLALDFIRKGRLQEAIPRLCNGLKIYPESPEINCNLGMVYFLLNNFEKAEKHVLISLRRRYFYVMTPDILIPGRLMDYKRKELVRKANDQLHRSPDTPLSEWNFDVALKEGNYFIEAYDLLGDIYFKKGDFFKSLLAFKKAIKLKSRDAMGRYNLGCSYWALDDWKNAEKEWRRAIKYEEETIKSEERTEISNNKLAISIVVRKQRAPFLAHRSLGNLYINKNLPDKALKEFLKAIEQEPSNPESYYDVGKIYENKSKLNEIYVKKAIFYYKEYLYLGGEKEEEVKKILRSLTLDTEKTEP